MLKFWLLVAAILYFILAKIIETFQVPIKEQFHHISSYDEDSWNFSIIES
jgi:hypothetical protein